MTDATLKPGYGEGGSGTGHTKTAMHPRLARVLRAAQEDISGLRIAPITSPDAATQGGAYVQADVQSIATLANELKAKLNALCSTLAAPVLTAGSSETYDLAGSSYELTVEIDGVNRVFLFQAGDFANPAAATAAECAAALNSRGYLAYGVVATDNSGDLELTGQPGSSHSLKGVAGGANAEFAFPTTAVVGTGYDPHLKQV